MTHGACEVVITGPDYEWLVNLCRPPLRRPRASSAHVIHPMSSIYRWEGVVHETTEARAFLRSRLELVEAIVAYVAPRHPYDVPNVTAIPIVGGNPAYLAWIHSNVRRGN